MWKGHYEQAVLVEDGIIRRIGSSDALLADAPTDATRVDCGGRTLIPGLNDSHMHFAQFSETLNQAHIADVKSIAELIEVCRKFAQEHPQRVKTVSMPSAGTRTISPTAAACRPA